MSPLYVTFARFVFTLRFQLHLHYGLTSWALIGYRVDGDQSGEGGITFDVVNVEIDLKSYEKKKWIAFFFLNQEMKPWNDSQSSASGDFCEKKKIKKKKRFNPWNLVKNPNWEMDRSPWLAIERPAANQRPCYPVILFRHAMPNGTPSLSIPSFLEGMGFFNHPFSAGTQQTLCEEREREREREREKTRMEIPYWIDIDHSLLTKTH